MPPLRSPFAFPWSHRDTQHIPLENLCVYALLFLLGALWAHVRCSGRHARKEHAA